MAAEQQCVGSVTLLETQTAYNSIASKVGGTANTREQQAKFLFFFLPVSAERKSARGWRLTHSLKGETKINELSFITGWNECRVCSCSRCRSILKGWFWSWIDVHPSGNMRLFFHLLLQSDICKYEMEKSYSDMWGVRLEPCRWSITSLSSSYLTNQSRPAHWPGLLMQYWSKRYISFLIFNSQVYCKLFCTKVLSSFSQKKSIKVWISTSGGTSSGERMFISSIYSTALRQIQSILRTETVKRIWHNLLFLLKWLLFVSFDKNVEMYTLYHAR